MPTGNRKVSGFVGNFRVTIRKRPGMWTRPRYWLRLHREMPLQKKVPNEFNLGLDTCRAIYIPFAQVSPSWPPSMPTTAPC